jgi:hypothetical protein
VKVKGIGFTTGLLLLTCVRAFAPPPLVTGDVPTADKFHFEWYVGMRYLIGCKYYVYDNLNIPGAIGKSLREGNKGGPDIRAYLGLKWEFGPFPWRKE